MVAKGEIAHVYTDGTSTNWKVGNKAIRFAGAGIYWKDNVLPEQSFRVDENRTNGKNLRTSQRASYLLSSLL